MKILIPIFVGGLLCLSIASQAENISPYLHLRKIKMRLVAQDLDGEDFKWLKRVGAKCENQDLNSLCAKSALGERIQSYLKTKAFVGRGVEFASNLLSLRPTALPAELVEKSSQDSLDRLIANIFSKNQSWDAFFTSADFQVNESEYYNGFIPKNKKPLVGDDTVAIHLSNPDLAAGFMVTPRFQERHFNTVINAGRKRAGEVLRVALCDSMVPAIERDEEENTRERLVALGVDSTVGPASDPTLAPTTNHPDSLHAQRRDCAQCHIYRGLDHMAWTFRSTELVLDTKPSPGRLTYLRSSGEQLDIPVRGVGDLARQLVQLPEFTSCQVRHFWSQYVGPAQFLNDNPEVQAAVEKTYRQTHGRVRDFIAQLMLRPELGLKELPTHNVDSTYASAMHVLQQCNGCHSGLAPSFTSYPIHEGRRNLTAFFIHRITERLALSPLAHTEARTMPPPSSAWQPREEELKAVLVWIQAGAPNANGKKQLSKRDVEEMSVRRD